MRYRRLCDASTFCGAGRSSQRSADTTRRPYHVRVRRRSAPCRNVTVMLGRRSALARRRGRSAPRPDSSRPAGPAARPGQVAVAARASRHGVRSGEVTTDSAVLWARSSGRGRMSVRLESNGRLLRAAARPLGRRPHRPHGAGPARRARARPTVRRHHLVHRRRRRPRARPERVSFSTAPIHAAPHLARVVGRHLRPGLGHQPGARRADGVRARCTDTRPDFFVHCGDTIYADGPIAESVDEPDGHVWRNVVTDGGRARSPRRWTEFRGRHRYTCIDDNVGALVRRRADRSRSGTTTRRCNNWYPGQVRDDDRYTEQRLRRARRAGRAGPGRSTMPMPIAPSSTAAATASRRRGSTARSRAARTSTCSCLDMRTYRGPNDTDRRSSRRTRILGAEQARLADPRGDAARARPGR